MNNYNFVYFHQIGRHSRVMMNERPLDGVGIPVYGFQKQTPFEKKRRFTPHFLDVKWHLLPLKELPSRFSPFYFFFYFWSNVWSILVKMCMLCSLPELFRTKLNSAPQLVSCKKDGTVTCFDSLGGHLIFDPKTLKGGIAMLFGSISTKTKKDSVSVRVFSCTAF